MQDKNLRLTFYFHGYNVLSMVRRISRINGLVDTIPCVILVVQLAIQSHWL